MNNDDLVIEAAGVRKSFRSGRRDIEVLAGVDFRLAAGDSASIQGESGSGKTTLLHLLAGLERPDAGDIRWRGSSITGLSVDRVCRRRAGFLGMIFQAYLLMPELTAVENVLLAARIRGRVGSDMRRRADDLLTRVGLEERRDHLPAKLSGGERQRVALARALLLRPPVVFADEPTGNLDEKTGEGVMEVLLGLCADEGASLILVTHNADFAARTRHRHRLHLGILEEAR